MSLLYFIVDSIISGRFGFFAVKIFYGGVFLKLTVKDMMYTALFTSLMAAGAFIKIPFPYVPLTFQPLFCALSGVFLGSRLGALSQLIYLCIGLAGLPIFASGGGITYIFNPSFGFLMGFVISSFITGKLVERKKDKSLNPLGIFISLVPGLVALNITGLSYFYFIKNIYFNENILFGYIFSAIFLPYFIKDLCLYFLASVFATKVLPVTGRLSGRITN